MSDTCDLEPFVPASTPQGNSLEEASTAGEIFQQQVAAYLRRLLNALCVDLQAIEDRLDALEAP
jgi:hypothetical protein